MLDYVLSLLLVYQYWLIFTITILAAFGIPLPATAVLIAGGAFYTQGYFNITYLLLAGFIGCISGDLLAYGISYTYGKDILIRMGLWKIINIDKFVDEHGVSFMKKSVLSVFLTRWLLTGFWPSINLLAGIMKMSPIKFFLVDITGEALYMAIAISIGYSFGTEWESILDIIESFSTMIVSFLLLIFGIYFFWKMNVKKNMGI